MNYKVIFLDTETTGLCNMRTPYNEDTLNNTWPHLTQLSYQLYQLDPDTPFSQWTLLRTEDSYIKPTYPSEKYDKQAEEVTGITYDYLQENGKDLHDTLILFLDLLPSVDFVVTHNTTFDIKMIKAEMLRLGLDFHLRSTPWIDTCYYGYQLTKMKTSNGRPKFPKLSELYSHCFPTMPTPPNLHHAIGDVWVLVQCFGVMTKKVLDSKHISCILNKRKKDYEERLSKETPLFHSQAS